MTNTPKPQANPVNEKIEVVTRYGIDIPTEYSFDGGKTFSTKPQANTLDELRQEILVEFKQVHKLAPADYTENCTNVVMSLIQAYYAKEIQDVIGEDEPTQVAIRPQGYKPPHSMQKVIKARHRNQLRAEIRTAIKEIGASR